MKRQEYKITTVAIIGLGALGILFANHLRKRMPKENIRIIADSERICKYQKQQIFCNGEVCDFHYMTPDEACEPADLVIFCVKYQGLAQAIDAVKNQVGEKTIIISALNGITSEAMIGEVYGMDKLLYCVAQGMDAVKEDNCLTYEHMGILAFGGKFGKEDAAKVKALATFFEERQFPHLVDVDMNRRMWGKFMLNVGVNQTATIMAGHYGELQIEGEAREMMIAAMREVIILSNKEGIKLTEEDLNYWLKILGTLNPLGKPSMRQDLEARRLSEVELFAGTVIQLGKKHHIETPINQELYQRITEIESQYKSRYA